MSAVGKTTAFAAEAALWIAGAAVVAGMAGAHWNVDVSVDSLLGATPAPSASSSPSASPTAALVTLAPGASPTVSPLVAKYQAYVSKADYQFVAKYVSSTSAIVDGKPFDLVLSGTTAYRNGDSRDSGRVTNDGSVFTDDTVEFGGTKYESINGGTWTKTARSADEIASDKLTNGPARLFFDRGVETKNGRQLHRLDIADPLAFSKALIKGSPSTTDAQLTYTVWVDDDGVPAAIHMEGWIVGPINKVSTKSTYVADLRIIATSGVTISAPV